MAANELNRTTPDTSLTGGSWIARTGAEGWKADGSKSVNGFSNAFLPFTPTDGHVYKVTVEANPDASGSSDWFALGFSQSANVGAGQGWHTSNTVHSWMLNRENDASTSVIQTFRGAGTANGASHDLIPDVVGPVQMSVVLDTTGVNWTVQWFAQGSAIRGPEAFGTNPTATSHVGIGAWNTATGSVDNFSLTIESSQVGLGADLAGAGSVDSAGSRLNIEGRATNLTAGYYRLDSFEYQSSGADGEVQPFLAVLTAPDTYEVVWVGPTFEAGPAGTVVELLSEDLLLLLAEGELYAGFNANGPVVMFADPDGPSVTDHNNPALFSIQAGDGIGGFTNNNLSRNYAFAINLTAVQVPEPATALLGLAGMTVLGLRRRRAA